MIHDISKVPPPRSVFKFHSESHFVKVENIPKDVDRQEILALFSALIGTVRTAEEQKDASGNTIMQLSFQDRDAAKKALCMNGYTVSGTALIVTRGPSTDGPSMQSKYPDMRRNLYVLGLPFALTKSEFTAIFSKFGTVAHCVILATVDNASRRRGFVVMSTHEEAKNAMANLSRTQIKGHTLDISWAVVQRSQGFLDGGDRAMFMADNPDSRNPSTPGDTESDAPDADFKPVAAPFKSMESAYKPLGDSRSCSMNSVASPPLPLTASPVVTLSGRSPTQNVSDLSAYEPSLTSTTTILVTNLPSVLFSQAADLRPLLCPFGTIKNLQVIKAGSALATSTAVLSSNPASNLNESNLQASALSNLGTDEKENVDPANANENNAPQESTTTVLVEYQHPAEAEDAYRTLKGQSYAQFSLEVQYLRPIAPVGGERNDGFSPRYDGYSTRMEGYGGRLEGYGGRLEGYGGRLEGHTGAGRFDGGRKFAKSYPSSPRLPSSPYLTSSPHISSSPYLTSAPNLLSSSPNLLSSPHMPFAYVHPSAMYANAMSPSFVGPPSPCTSASPCMGGGASCAGGISSASPCLGGGSPALGPHSSALGSHTPTPGSHSSCANGSSPCMHVWHGGPTATAAAPSGLFYNAPHYMVSPHDLVAQQDGGMGYDYLRRMPVLPTQSGQFVYPAFTAPMPAGYAGF
ncbi:hypothetical protein GGG16DRAFT_109291 [Schizophyllum commune]